MSNGPAIAKELDGLILLPVEKAPKLHALVEALEENDEVQEVYTNAE